MLLAGSIDRGQTRVVGGSIHIVFIITELNMNSPLMYTYITWALLATRWMLCGHEKAAHIYPGAGEIELVEEVGADIGRADLGRAE